LIFQDGRIQKLILSKNHIDFIWKNKQIIEIKNQTKTILSIKYNNHNRLISNLIFQEKDKQIPIQFEYHRRPLIKKSGLKILSNP